MIRKLLATTALATVIATGAYAQDAAKPGQTKVPEAAATADTSATTAPPAADASAQTQQAADAGNYLQNLSADQYMASELDGASLYASEAQDAETIGEIQNFLVGSDGTVVAAIVDATVGDQSKTVAVPFDQITWTVDQDNEPRAVLNLSADQLAQAPAFTKPNEQQASTQAEGSVTPPAGDMSADTAANIGATTQPAADASTQTAAATDTAPTAETQTEAKIAADTAQPDANAAATQTASSSTGGGEFLASVGADQYLSENIIGAEVYSGPGEDADEIGEINDLVLASSGKIEAGVVGVGGFLGIGEKDVAVPFDQFQMSREADDNDDVRVTLAASKDQLEKAPSFEDERSDQMAATANGAAAGGGMTAGTNESAANVEASTQKSAEYTEKLAADANTNTNEAADKAAMETTQAANNAETKMDNAAQQTQQAADAAAAGTAGVAASTADATTTASTGGTGQQAQMTPVTDQSQLTADKLMGTTVYGPNDQTVGEIGDIALSKDGKVDAVIVDVGGFLGIGEKEVAVAMDNLQFMQDANGSLYLYTQFSEEQLKSQPEYNADTYAESRDTMRLQSGAMPAQSSNTAPAPAAEQPATKTN
ncbi:PRC-barrel domain-containing protein [Aurantimonas marina]|uniref:PRC-barrel domain-containing protein n=1 Tax=Aurantimonas marina TaxID=2780508 RepID=UPI0019D20043|nr:PRC-barrel domain-containing protein [Aurantimonas marina]